MAIAKKQEMWAGAFSTRFAAKHFTL